MFDLRQILDDFVLITRWFRGDAVRLHQSGQLERTLRLEIWKLAILRLPSMASTALGSI
ncbi:hypothetical protein [Bradyrhizobium sp. DOA9]|uniref:hypothetical protein n=1 Tax=Bradyrhizobium sp. DOA9 TaxID=1126627 RepID=UPI000A519731|nr:hypothetical protein [Bradyrhizobium sp. DOA9]